MSEKEYIERKVAIDRLFEAIPYHFALQTGLERAINYLREIPAADVRPVVTCGKCKYGKYTGIEWFCDKHSGHADKFGEDASYHEYHSKHWFCADGEERNNES